MENLTLYERIKLSAEKFPNVNAIYYQGRKITYRKFHKMILEKSRILANVLNVKKGDVVLIAQPNIPDTLALFYAVNKIGAIANMVHPFTPFNQIRNIMSQTKTKVAFLFEQRVAKEVERYRDIADEIIVTRVEDYLPPIKKVIYHFMNRNIRKTLSTFRNFKGFTYLHNLKAKGKVPETVSGEFVNECGILLHSGSTTGDPKTIKLTSRGFNFSASHASEYLCCDVKDVVGCGMLGVLPSFHGFGLCICMHTSLSYGMTLCLIPKFSAKATNDAMNAVKMKCIIGVPTMYEAILKDKKLSSNKRFKHLIVAWSGGDSMSPSLKTRFDDMVKSNGGHAKLFEGYGLTESISVVILNTYDHNKTGSIGYPSSGMEIKILDEENNEVNRGELGEICIKSPTNMLGYYNDPKATEEALIGGYLHTGDIGYMDEDDFIFFKQRKKRVVKVSGVGVFPTEIEQLIESIPGVEKCCAVSIPDKKLIAAIKVFVVAKYFDEQGMRNQIMDTCRKYLIRWAVPKEIEFRSSLPLTLLGKVDFKVLQKEEDEKRK
jgi:long-chain acyl-CoA synthetase